MQGRCSIYSSFYLRDLVRQQLMYHVAPCIYRGRYVASTTMTGSLGNADVSLTTSYTSQAAIQQIIIVRQNYMFLMEELLYNSFIKLCET